MHNLRSSNTIKHCVVLPHPMVLAPVVWVGAGGGGGGSSSSRRKFRSLTSDNMQS